MDKKSLVIILVLGLLGFSACAPQRDHPEDHVSLDFDMVEAGIDWLDLIQSGAPDEHIKVAFMERVVPTQGCQAIIHHWARFRKWDAEELYTFIMTALGRMPSEEALRKNDGSLTFFGMRRELWQTAIRDTSRMRSDLQVLREADLLRSIAVVRPFLPEAAGLDVRFSFVLFGHSSAFSVGKENGFDFLQLPRKADDTIDVDQIIQIFAHELHHSGFAFLNEMKQSEAENQDRFLLMEILASEGMPTYFIDKPKEHLAEFRNSENSLMQMVAADWETHTARLPALYREAEADILANLEGRLNQSDIMQRWMAGAKGPAYILGGDMIRVIDTYLGRKEAVAVALDPRKLLQIYNRAARRAEARGEPLHIFIDSLADRTAGSAATK